MNRDDIRKLIGGYATGSLTEAERKILFDAALDHQDLFDELAREQALKELIEEPGAKQRLIAGLRPRSVATWWKRPLVWVGAMAVAAGVVVTGWLALRPSRPMQLAQVSPATSPVPPAVGAVAGSSAPVRSSPTVASVRRVAPARAAVKRSAQEKTVREMAIREKSNPPPQRPPARGIAIGALTDKSADKPVATAQTDLGAARGGGGGMGGAAPRAASPVVPAPLAAPQPMRGSVGGPGNRVELSQATSGFMAKTTARFGFSYRLEADGNLIITAPSDGYLSVGSIFPESFVAKDSTTRIDLSKNQSLLRATAGLANPETIVIHFSAKKGADGNTAPIERNTVSGTVEDPHPSADSNLIVAITLK